jgi:hypothetical protein
MKVRIFTDAERTSARQYADALKAKEAKAGSRDDRNNDNGPRRWANHFEGKLAEYAVRGLIGGRTDDAVYLTGDATVARHEIDIFACPANPLRGVFGRFNNFVKSCSYDARGRECDSWTILPSDPTRRSPGPLDVIHLCYVDRNGRQGKVWGFVFAQDVAGLWDPCKKLDHKVAIYRERLEREGIRVYGYGPEDQRALEERLIQSGVLVPELA